MRGFHRRLSLILLAASILAGADMARADFLVVARDDDTVTELVNGSSLTLNSEGIGSAVSTTLRITFTGPATSSGEVDEPELTGSTTFAVTTAGELPSVLDSGDIFDFRLTFTPTGVGPFTARLVLKLTQRDAGAPDRERDVLINLTGQAADYTLSFEFPDGNETLLPEGAVLAFPDTERDQSTTATMIVTNRGTGPGSVQSVTIDGDDAFEVSGLALLPSVVDAGRDLRFDVIFTPPAPAAFQGSLDIRFGVGSRNVILVGREAGAAFQYETTVNGSSNPIQIGDTLSFDITQTGDENATRFRVTNGGQLESVVNTIAVTGDDFSLVDEPILPRALDPGQSVEFGVAFDPEGVGASAGQLEVNAALFLLSGTVAALPSASIAPTDQVVEPADQLPVGVTLSEAYPVDLKGTVTLNFFSDVFSDDPTVQFSAGGRQADFVIPANRTEAEFRSTSQDLFLQTGTVAGSIELTSTFETVDTEIDLTPSLPPRSVLSVLRDKPELRALTLGTVTGTSISLQVTGFATPRSVTDLLFQFTGVADGGLQTTSLQANVENAFVAYYQTGQSSSFGSQFTATVSLNVDGNVNDIAAIEIRAENAEGVSESLSVELQ
jgi:hypothetical protein